MSKHRGNIVYFLGAGRSGTTALATILNSHPDLRYTGELHHFFKYLSTDAYCSCGKRISQCSYWSNIINELPDSIKDNAQAVYQFTHSMEYHTAILPHLLHFTSSKRDRYAYIQQQLIGAIKNNTQAPDIIDAAKYIGRFLALKQAAFSNIKALYLVRDVRGVIWSFQKNVQTSQPPYRTLVYYYIINFIALMLYIFPSRSPILKIYYEDFIHKPDIVLQKIGAFLEHDMETVQQKIHNNASFPITHIVGGNRLKKKQAIKLRRDIEWQNKMPKWKQLLYYILALPLMLIHGYKVFPRS